MLLKHEEYQPRSVRITSNRSASLDVFGEGEQLVLNQNLIFNAVYYKGDTIFRPPDYEYRLTAVVNANRVEADEVRALYIDPQQGDTRNDSHIGIQDLYVDKHLRNVSDQLRFRQYAGWCATNHGRFSRFPVY